MNVAILGGSFNPIHMGHLWIAKQVKESRKVDVVWLMPNKGAKHWGKNIVDSIHRYQMCNLAIQDFDSELVLSDLEIWKEFEFTYQTIDHLTYNKPQNKYFWIVGADWDCSKFKNYETLKEECEFIKVQRNGQKGNFDTEISFQLSSTSIRQRIRDGKKITGLVTQSVEKYINESSIYAKVC